ncbi:RNA 2',3'-cyclic phosphodiesterase [invertebrate metagenome]|uniref:RNA 2',3'-cyclic phosphodiesterase n=1 Tax=invertebrate metagenome TaxID=1711999 RepID=A0A2H9TAN1_9ZZZZ
MTDNFFPIRTFLAIPVKILEWQTLSHFLSDHYPPFIITHWIPTQKHHLTLKFLGNSYQNQLSKLANILKKSFQHIPAFQCSAHCLTKLPIHQSPRFLVLAVQPDSRLTELAEICDQAALSCDFPASRHSFFPHISLARFPQSQKIETFLPKNNIKPVTFSIKNIHLFISHQKSKQPVYQTVKVFSLQTVT